MERSDVINLLKNDIVRIEFEKVNGEYRDMKATLDSRFIPEADDEKTTSIKEYQAVWDISKADWRSFRWDNVLRINGEEYEDSNPEVES